MKNIGQLLSGIILLAIGIGVIVWLVNLNHSGDQPQTMSIDEAQAKCMLMEEADLVNLDGQPFGSATTKKAQDTCLAQWDMSKNPNNTEDKFKEAITSDWENRKTETLEGHTLEELYNESVK